jgi:hypothetical protein
VDFGQLVAPEQSGNHCTVLLVSLLEIRETVFLVNNELQADFLKIVFKVRRAIPQQRCPKLGVVGVNRILQQSDFDGGGRKRPGRIRVHVLEKTICGTR